MQRFLSELQRRKVLRIASAYVVGGWIVLQVALALQTAMNLPAWFSTVVVSLLIIAFPIALVAAWFLEITPDGIKRTTASGDGALIKPQTTDFILAAMLALVLVVALVQAVIPRDGAPAPAATTATLGDKSIAVLPFANLSPDKENEYFADGLTEELLNLLAKIGDLKVISRTSSFAFKGKDTPLPEIAKQLGVRHILEGSVRTEGDELRVTAQLIDVSTDTHLWSETYERKVDSVFALQDEIAREIASALKVEVTLADRDRQPPTNNLEAYRMFLRARALQARSRSPDDLAVGVELYKQALALDPMFAEAHAGLATNYNAMIATLGGTSKQLRSLARQSANTALELNPRLARAYGVLGTLARQEFSWEAAIDNYSKAIALDSSDTIALVSLATTRSMLGDFKESKRLRDRVMRLDPIYGFLVGGLPIFDAFALRDDPKVAEMAAKLTTGFAHGAGLGMLTIIARERGDIDAAERSMRATFAEYGISGPIVESAVRALKSRAAFDEVAKVVRAAAAKNPTIESEGIFFAIGDYDRFFDGLEARVARGETSRFWVWLSFAWRAASGDLNANKRFKDLARNTGLVDYWKKHGWPDRCRAKGEDDFECN